MIVVHVNIYCQYPFSVKGQIEKLNDNGIKSVSVLTGKPEVRAIIEALTGEQVEETVIKIQNLRHVHRTDTQWVADSPKR